MAPKSLLALTLLLGACVGKTQHYAVVDQAKFYIASDSKDLALEMGDFLESRGYELHSSAPEHLQYRDHKITKVGLDTDVPGCVSFVVYIETPSADTFVPSSSNDLISAKQLARDFLNHFGKDRTMERGSVCYAP